MKKKNNRVYGILTVLCLILAAFLTWAMSRVTGAAASALGIGALLTGAAFTFCSGKLIREKDSEGTPSAAMEEKKAAGNDTRGRIYALLSALCLILAVLLTWAMGRVTGAAASALGIGALLTGAAFTFCSGKLIREKDSATH